MGSDGKPITDRSILVTGATGFIGRHLLANLIKDGLIIYALTRQTASYLSEYKDVRVIQGNITEDIIVPYGVDTIYHCAGVILNQDLMESVNVSGTRKVVEAAMKNNCRMIHLSSAGVVGRPKTDYIDENTECSPQSLYERTKLEAEKIVRKGIASGLDAQILRPTSVFGIGRNPLQDSFLHLILSMKSGRYRSIGDGNGIYNIIHVNEVVRAMRALDSDDISNGGVYFINTPISFKEMHRIVQEETLGEVNELLSLPYSIALGAIAIFSLMSLVTGKKMPLTLSRLRALTNKKVFSQNRLIDITSYRTMLTVEDYIRQACMEYAKKGLLN